MSYSQKWKLYKARSPAGQPGFRIS